MIYNIYRENFKPFLIFLNNYFIKEGKILTLMPVL